MVVEDNGEDDVAERRSRILKKAAEKQLELVYNPYSVLPILLTPYFLHFSLDS